MPPEPARRSISKRSAIMRLGSTAREYRPARRGGPVRSPRRTQRSTARARRTIAASNLEDDMTNPNTGRFTWHELMTTDPAAAARFYAEVLGWSVQEVDMGPMGTYRLFKQGDKQ